jgi:uncharacterized protein (TIGR00369 family)
VASNLPPDPQATLAAINARGAVGLPALLGVTIIEVKPDGLVGRLAIRPDLLAPNGFLHAGTIVTLADTTCGYGTYVYLPPGAQSFTTIELKTNFLGTAREGALRCDATLVHGGRTTQVWDAQVRDDATGRVIALFRCTQLLIYPQPDR